MRTILVVGIVGCFVLGACCGEQDEAVVAAKADTYLRCLVAQMHCAVVNGSFADHIEQAGCVKGIELQQERGTEDADEACATLEVPGDRGEPVPASETCLAGVGLGELYCDEP